VVVGAGVARVVGNGGSVTPGMVDPTGTVGNGLVDGAMVGVGATVTATVDKDGKEELAARVVGALRRLVVATFLLGFARVVVRLDFDLLAGFVVALDAVLETARLVVTAPCADADPAAVAISVLIISALITRAPRARRPAAELQGVVLAVGKRDMLRPYRSDLRVM
jgi:hypothetical protein